MLSQNWNCAHKRAEDKLILMRSRREAKARTRPGRTEAEHPQQGPGTYSSVAQKACNEGVTDICGPPTLQQPLKKVLLEVEQPLRTKEPYKFTLVVTSSSGVEFLLSPDGRASKSTCFSACLMPAQLAQCSICVAKTCTASSIASAAGLVDPPSLTLFRYTKRVACLW